MAVLGLAGKERGGISAFFFNILTESYRPVFLLPDCNLAPKQGIVVYSSVAESRVERKDLIYPAVYILHKLHNPPREPAILIRCCPT